MSCTFEKAKELLDSYLDKVNGRKTNERYEILKELCNSDEHFSVDSVYQSLCKKKYLVSRGTVFNAFSLFCKCGLLRRLVVDSSCSKYECTIDLPIHSHLVCMGCGCVENIDGDALDVTLDKIAVDHKFEIGRMSFTIYGMCKRCRK